MGFDDPTGRSTHRAVVVPFLRQVPSHSNAKGAEQGWGLFRYFPPCWLIHWQGQGSSLDNVCLNDKETIKLPPSVRLVLDFLVTLGLEGRDTMVSSSEPMSFCEHKHPRNEDSDLDSIRWNNKEAIKKEVRSSRLLPARRTFAGWRAPTRAWSDFISPCKHKPPRGQP
jgi:hypothetical protein